MSSAPPERQVRTRLRDPSKEQQVSYFREHVNPEFEIERPRGTGRLYSYLMRYKFDTALEAVPFRVHDQCVLNVCCGSGMDIEFMAHTGARVIGLDLSKDAVRRTRERAARYGFAVQLVVGDAENLPFRNDAVALGFVHDGLHHLPEPHRALRELVRVSRRGIVLTEPANAAVTRLAVKLGVSEEYEEAGNYVYRLSKPELVSLFHSLGVRALTIRRYLMYYHHEPKWYYRLFDYTVPFRLFQVLFWLVNAVVSRWGNKLMCLALKDGPKGP